MSGEPQKAEIGFLNTFYDYKNKKGERTTWYGFFSQQRFGFEQMIGYV
jgi:hypothetical protein